MISDRAKICAGVLLTGACIASVYEKPSHVASTIYRGIRYSVGLFVSGVDAIVRTTTKVAFTCLFGAHKNRPGSFTRRSPTTNRPSYTRPSSYYDSYFFYLQSRNSTPVANNPLFKTDSKMLKDFVDKNFSKYLTPKVEYTHQDVFNLFSVLYELKREGVEIQDQLQDCFSENSIGESELSDSLLPQPPLEKDFETKYDTDPLRDGDYLDESFFQDHTRSDLVTNPPPEVIDSSFFNEKLLIPNFLDGNLQASDITVLESMVSTLIEKFSDEERLRFVMRMNQSQEPWADELRELAFDHIFVQKNQTYTSQKKWVSVQEQVHYLRSHLTKLENLQKVDLLSYNHPDLKGVIEKYCSKSNPQYSPELHKLLIVDLINQFRQRINSLEKSCKEGRYVTLPMYYHATKGQEAVESIMKSGIEVRHQGPNKGAFVSTEHELYYGNLTFAFPSTLGVNGTPLEHFFNQSYSNKSRYWLGFGKALPVALGGGETSLVYFIFEGTEKERLKETVRIANKYKINTNTMTVVSAEVAALEQSLLQECRGLPFPKQVLNARNIV